MHPLCLQMDEFGCLLNHQENVEELKQKLYYTTMERDSLKIQASEQLVKHNQQEAQLLMLLEVAYRERDETNKRLQKLLEKMTPAESDDLKYQAATQLKQANQNPSITESDSFSNLHSNGSSTVDSFLDGGVSSSELSGISMADSRRMSILDHTPVGGVAEEIDPTDPVMDKLARGLTLPPKGKLLGAVMEASPPLQSLMVAGPLPVWKNPPPLRSLPIAYDLRKSAMAVSHKLKEVQSQVGSMTNCSASLLDFRYGSSYDVGTFSSFRSLNEGQSGIKRKRLL